MPIAIPTLQARIKFSLPDSRLDPSIDPSIYPTTHSITRPTEVLTIPITDLRPEFEAEEKVDPVTQLETRGFAVVVNESEVRPEELEGAEGTERYLEETCRLVKEITGASRVIAWNSVMRRADVQSLKVIPRQSSPERNKPPSTHVQPTAGLAHIDQNEFYGRKICEMATKDPNVIPSHARCQIINVWRPIKHAVTNSPLAMLDYRTLEVGKSEGDPESDLSVHASIFGFGQDLHYGPRQRWSYVQHQTPSEAILIKCYDSYQGRDGIAKFCGHVAADIVDEPEYEGEGAGKPRESIEVRLVVLHE